MTQAELAHPLPPALPFGEAPADERPLPLPACALVVAGLSAGLWSLPWLALRLLHLA